MITNFGHFIYKEVYYCVPYMGHHNIRILNMMKHVERLVGAGVRMAKYMENNTLAAGMLQSVSGAYCIFASTHIRFDRMECIILQRKSSCGSVIYPP